MNPDTDTPPTLNDPAVTEATGHIGPLYEGDAGELPAMTRRTLVQLLLGPALEERRHPELWPVLLRDETVIRRRLGDLFLVLALDRERGVAFLRQAVSEEIAIPILLRKAPLTFIDSALLLHLRELLAQADARLERAAVSAKDLRDHLRLYERAANTDHAGFGRRVNAAFEKMKKYGILRDLDRDDDRKEISPTLRLLFDATVVASLVKTYRGLAECADPAVLMDDDVDSDAEPEDA